MKNSEIIITTVSHANIPLENGEFQKQIILENIGAETGVVYSCALWLNNVFQSGNNLSQADAVACLAFFLSEMPV